LEAGTAQIGDGAGTAHLYRLATGEVVALDRPPGDDEAAEIADPQAVLAMSAIRAVGQALYDDYGVLLERECRHLPPFALIRCPLCHSTEFTSLDLASAWCARCNAQFTVRPTTGDPGFVVDCTWQHYSYLDARYVVPRTGSLVLTLVLKDSRDPRDMAHEPDGSCWTAAQDGSCRPDAPALTGGDGGLRPGLHRCRVGTLYDWSLNGRVPAPEDLDRNGSAWDVDGQPWPRCATVRVVRLDRGEKRDLQVAAGDLRKKWPNLSESLERMANARSEPPVVYHQAGLPPISGLREGEYYLLHRWATAWDSGRDYSFEYACPVWYVVRPVLDDGYVEGWDVVRRDVCPVCGGQVRPGDVNAEGDRWKMPHGYCRETWQAVGWQPQF
jgi:hypothetical protein